jgi:predicted Abi (CAAX) family protease
MKMKKVKKIVGWTILAGIIVCILSVPIIAMGWREGLITWAVIFALSGITYWAMDAITED